MAISTTLTAPSAQSIASSAPQTTVAELDASCRWPLLALFGSAVLWLFAGSVLGFINTMKFHVPGFLAHCPCFSYGRVQASQSTALLYGFGIQAALGIGLWLLVRLGRAKLVGPGTIITGLIFWNSAVTIGLCAIMGGDASGYDSLQMPGYMGGVLLWAYILIAVCGVLTYHRREELTSYPSQWFVIAGLFWFAWVFSLACLLLFCHPVRGVVQASIAWWYAHNLTNVVLTFSGLAAIFYFIPKLINRPLHSSYMAGVAFWGLALFGSWGGIPMGAPLPSWIPAMAAVGTVFTLVPVLAVALNFYQTIREESQPIETNPTLRFIFAALVLWLIASIQQIVGAFPSVGAITNFTWFTVAQKNLHLYGFFAMAAFGAMYYILPRLLQMEWPCSNLIKAHFWLMLGGVLLSYLSLVWAGASQGILLLKPDNSFVTVMNATMMPVRVSSLGDLLVVGGVLCFLLNFARLLAARCCACCKSCKKEAGK